MFKLTEGMIIVTIGLIGLVIILAESPKQIGSKIPLALFFVMIMIVGIWIEIKMKEGDETFGEVEGRRSYG